MAVAEIIGAAVGVMMLVIVAYVLVGSVLTTAEIVNNAQKDNTLQQEVRLGTDFEITDAIDSKISDTKFRITFNIHNTGSEVIHDFSHMDIFTYDDGVTGSYQLLTPNNDCLLSPDESWCIDSTTKQLDPDKIMGITAFSSLNNNIWVVTSNGVYRSTPIL